MQALATVHLAHGSNIVDEWAIKKKHLKNYPHFDPVISPEEATALVINPEYVATHKYYPLLLYNERYTKFGKKGAKGEEKVRPIRYAARIDSYIYLRYRYILSEQYEAALRVAGLHDNVIAYRRIKCKGTGEGKCNIHFAHEAIKHIQRLGDCFVLALDIKSFFESLDHKHLKKIWCRLLGISRLPEDHFKVYENVTAYSYVEQEEVYRRLGLFGKKYYLDNGRIIEGYLLAKRDMPRHLCDGHTFRKKVAGDDGSTSAIKKNLKNYGIPQGTSLSDLLANAYLLDFDAWIKEKIEGMGGVYLRYSDDIFIALPVGEISPHDLLAQIEYRIGYYGKRLQIKASKTSIFQFFRSGSRQRFNLLRGATGRNGLEYLGFRYDGCRAYIRDSTISNLKRKIVYAVRREVRKLIKRYPDKNVLELMDLFNYEEMMKRFGRVENFEDFASSHRNWTFWTYATRASALFGDLGRPFFQQMKGIRRTIKLQVSKELIRQKGA